MSFLTTITSFGVAPGAGHPDRRNITLTNSIALVVAAIPILLAVAVLFLSEFDLPVILRLVAAAILFLLPIVLNRFSFTFASRVLLCWSGCIIVFAVSILDIKSGSAMSASSYVGLRLFLIPIACFPFLIFSLRERAFLFLSLSGPLLSLLLFDPVFTFFGTAYSLRNAPDPLYAFNNIRALASFLAITVSCYLLKTTVERNENLNRKLLLELAEKNELIRRQAESDLHALNRKLNENVKQLKEREFILNQSQRIAKMGSWEYTIENASLFCSDEIYNIFGVSAGFVFSVENLSALFLEEDSKILIHAVNVLLQTGQSFDLAVRAHTPFGYTKWIRVNAFPIEQNKRILGVTGICHDITYFKEAEDLLRISENKYRSLFEQASDFIFILNFDGQVLDVNASVCTAFGYRKDELIHLNIRQLVDPIEAAVRPLPFAALSRGEHFLTERRMVRRDKEIIHVESNVRMLSEGRILVIARDVTRLREAQREIELSEARFRGAFEFSAIGMALVSLELRWVKVNKELCHILGYSETQLLSLGINDVTDPGDRAEDRRLVLQVLSGEIDSFQRQKRYLHKDGAVIWANLNVSAVKDANDLPLYFVSQIEDITAEKKAAELLALAEANLKATINNTKVLIWSIDTSFRLLMFNNPFYEYIKRHYGVTLEIGSPIFDQNSEPGLTIYPRWNKYLDRLLTGESFTFEEQRFGFDFHYSVSPIFEAEKVIGATVFVDNITEQKKHERELADANQKIDDYRLMALRSVMSPHFIFNVLNSIQFYIAKSDRLNAINYLSTFSKLIRGILTQSVDHKIRLADEVDMLRNYILLEMTRFEKKFSFVFDIDSRIDLTSVQIPSLLIQPHVENAILHGLYNKKAPGILTIRILDEGDDITFEIEDNGVGRVASAQLRQQHFPAHKSMGIRVSEERLKLISQKERTAFEIKDLVDNEGIACGTKVIIRISV